MLFVALIHEAAPANSTAALADWECEDRGNGLHRSAHQAPSAQSTARLAQLLTGAIKVARKLEKFVRPRLSFLHAGSSMLRLIGLGIVIAGLGLMLPLPIPFSNNIPAWAVVLLAIGMMERDGLCVLVGHLTAIVAWVYIGLTSVLAVGGFQRLLDFFQL